MNDQKNYETIVFEVEKELEKPKSSLHKNFLIIILLKIFLQLYFRE